MKPLFEFHINRAARVKFAFADSFFSTRGNVVFANFQAAQSFAEQINQARTEEQSFVTPAHINAMGLLHETIHQLLEVYREEVNPDVFLKCEQFLTSHLGEDAVAKLLQTVTKVFPPLPVFQSHQTPKEYLDGFSGSMSNKHIMLEELLLIYLQNQNPSLRSVRELIDDSEIANQSSYVQAIKLIEQFFEKQPTFASEELPLFQLLLEPIKRSPDSIMDQLAFLQSRWQSFSPKLRFNFSLLQAIDFIKEEGKYFLFKQQAEAERTITPTIETPFFPTGFTEKESPPVPEFKTEIVEAEPEKFSPDLSWMPRLILIAKNAFVWLNQLSKKYSRTITRLDEIPDEELDRLSSYGITGLWLIGIWNRSAASKRIKHLHGNIDAEASAYSLENYNVSDELGGYKAYLNLRERAKHRGIRLACDMVPNHMGMDSDWVIHHPDWFVQTDFPPYPNYSFNGPDLSHNVRVGIFLEDGYWRRSDAAVVFKRVDRFTGDVKYMYHGNDGTNMPWNDTAQLNFLKAEVREAVIQTILHVARMFPVIRFDAAMVLAKKHFQRLWFPQPGTGGAVPSRAMFGLTKEQFDSLMPIEFWREVVDRVQQEVPDTLLLAEAFWLMEGYFVRTLGMHRVYNSAFMHMLKKEENANFKQSIKNVMEFNPQILKRHVNFMSNPDEETAIAQFGSHDKYFGVCIMMITLPGLPMFGHGQIEGFTEKYGMEYRRAYHDEFPDGHLIWRHEQEIFPLLKKRYLFAEVENFQLFDFFNDDGSLNDDVFVFSNRFGNERALVIYNNAYERASGTVSITAAPQLVDGTMKQTNLTDALQLSFNPDSFIILKDEISKFEYLRPTREMYEQGISFRLDGFKVHVFLNFKEDFASEEKPYHQLAERLNGNGVPSIEEELAHLRLEPLHHLIKNLLTEQTLATLHVGRKKRKASVKSLRLLQNNFNEMLNVARTFDRKFTQKENRLELLDSMYASLLELTFDETKPSKKSVVPETLKASVKQRLATSGEAEHRGWHVGISWMCLHHLTSLRATESDIINDWKMERIFTQAFSKLETQNSFRECELVKLLVAFSKKQEPSFTTRLTKLFDEPLAEQFIGINQWQDELYFSKEKFEELLDWLMITEAVTLIAQKEASSPPKEVLQTLFEETTVVRDQAEKVGYRFEELMLTLQKTYTGKEL
ncbi:MAG: alpha-amylase [Ignavibacteriae bacterium]|nr:alpha-amylase [Ignavibacteriota bacterium]